LLITYTEGESASASASASGAGYDYIDEITGIASGAAFGTSKMVGHIQTGIT
jgi:hypothetical protein